MAAPLSPLNPPSPTELDRVATSVLSGPPFTTRLDTPGFTELARTWHEGLTDGFGLGSGLMTGAAVLAGVALLLTVVWSVRSLMGTRALTVRPVATPNPGPHPDPAARQELARARAALEAGAHRRAVELAWRAVNVGVGAASVLTPRQWARWAAMRLSAHGRGELVQLLALHERSCYAGKPTDRTVAEAAVSIASRLGEP